MARKPKLFPPTLTDDRKVMVGHNYSVHLIWDGRIKSFDVLVPAKRERARVLVHPSGTIRCIPCGWSTDCHHAAGVDTMVTLLKKPI